MIENLNAVTILFFTSTMFFWALWLRQKFRYQEIEKDKSFVFKYSREDGSERLIIYPDRNSDEGAIRFMRISNNDEKWLPKKQDVTL